MTSMPIATKDKSPLAPHANGAAAIVTPQPPALPLDLTTLADDVLARLAAEAPREIDRRQAKKEQDLLAFIKEQAAVLGLTPARLAAALAGKTAARPRTNGGTDGRSTVKPKYRNPKDHAQTWSGRGAPPKWLTDHLEAGGAKEDLAIPPDGMA
jgi:DNA-binding protein H-NS